MNIINLLGSQSVRRLVVVVFAGAPCIFGGAALCPAQDVKITAVEVTPESELRITISSPAGELIVECSDDLQTWIPIFPIGTDGADVEVTGAPSSPLTYCRVIGFPDSNDFHLNGSIAQALQSTIPYGDLQTVFGLGAGPPSPPVSVVRNLPAADRNERVYAATIGLLSVLGQNLRDTIVPQPSVAEVVAALAADLDSGSLNGRDSGGSLIQVGTSGSFLPEYTDVDLAAASAQMGDELSGLRNVMLQSVGGLVSAAAPGCWNTFYWDSSDWQ